MKLYRDPESDFTFAPKFKCVNIKVKSMHTSSDSLNISQPQNTLGPGSCCQLHQSPQHWKIFFSLT